MDSTMNLILFAVLGGYIGWKLGQMNCAFAGHFALTRNILIGTGGALASELFVMRIMGRSAPQDFAASASLASLGAVLLLVGVHLVRQCHQALRSRSSRH